MLLLLLCRWHLEVTNYALRKQKLCRKRDKPLIFVGKPRQLRTYLVATNLKKKGAIEDVLGSYKLEKKRRTNSASPLHHRPPKLWKKPLQPRSQGSLLPALRSEGGREREREGERERERERTWERGWSRGGRCTFFPFITFDTRVNKTNFKAMKKSAIFFLPLHSLVRTKIKTEYKSVTARK